MWYEGDKFQVGKWNEEILTLEMGIIKNIVMV